MGPLSYRRCMQRREKQDREAAARKLQEAVQACEEGSFQFKNRKAVSLERWKQLVEASRALQ